MCANEGYIVAIILIMHFRKEVFNSHFNRKSILYKVIWKIEKYNTLSHSQIGTDKDYKQTVHLQDVI